MLARAALLGDPDTAGITHACNGTCMAASVFDQSSIWIAEQALVTVQPSRH